VLQPGTQAGASVSANIKNIVGQKLGGFNYDAPIVRGVTKASLSQGPSVPGSMVLELSLSNIGVAAPKPIVRLTGLPPTTEQLQSQLVISIDNRYCMTTAWLSASSASCVTIENAWSSTEVGGGPGGGGAQFRTVSVSIGGSTGTLPGGLDFSNLGVVCANGCNQAKGLGKCVNNRCVCSPGYSGADCSLRYCGYDITFETLSTTTGVITDHTELTYFYNPWYQAGRKCAWVVKPSAGQLEIAFTKFDLSPVHSISIYAGTDGTGALLATLGGTDTIWGYKLIPVPGPLRVPGGVAFIALNAPADIPTSVYPYTGFELSYAASDAGCPANCNSHVGQGSCKNSKCECVVGWGGSGCEVGYVALQDTFTDIEGITNQLWLEQKGAVFNFGCGEHTGTTGKSFHFRGRGSRYLISPKLDLSAGGTVSFYLRIGTGPRGACANAVPTRPGVFDGPSAGSAVQLQWTIDTVIRATTTWTTFDNGVFSVSPYQTFRLVQVTVTSSLSFV
jgi:hypothetical protein